MDSNYDVIVVGGGPGGATAALDLARRNLRTALIEREHFPRYHIGESLTGECARHLRELGLEQKLTDSALPKRGVVVYGKDGANSFWLPVARRDEDGKLAAGRTWQVRRSEFDDMLLEESRQAGVEHIKAEALAPLRDGAAIRGLTIRDDAGAERELGCRVLVDASGSSTYLTKHGVIGPKVRGHFDNQTAVFSQVRGTIREGERVNDTFIFYDEKNHWAWFIPLDDDLVSVGVVGPASYLRDRLGTDGGLEAYLQREIRELNPELARRVPDTALYEPVRTASNYSYKVERYSGPNYLCVGDAHQFIDPIFSFGVYLAVHEALQAGEAIERYLSSPGTEAEPFRDYEHHCNLGQNLLSDMVEFFWEQPLWFGLMVNQEHRDEFVDYFAGRIYFEDDGSRPGLKYMRDALVTSRAYADKRAALEAKKAARASGVDPA